MNEKDEINSIILTKLALQQTLSANKCLEVFEMLIV